MIRRRLITDTAKRSYARCSRYPGTQTMFFGYKGGNPTSWHPQGTSPHIAPGAGFLRIRERILMGQPARFMTVPETKGNRGWRIVHIRRQAQCSAARASAVRIIRP